MQATNVVKNPAPKVFDMVFEGFIKAHETDHVAATHVGEVVGADGAKICFALYVQVNVKHCPRDNIRYKHRGTGGGYEGHEDCVVCILFC